MELKTIVGVLYRDNPELRGVTAPARLATALIQAGRNAEAEYVANLGVDELERAATSWFIAQGEAHGSVGQAKQVASVSGGRTSASAVTASLAQQLLKPWSKETDTRDVIGQLVRELPHVQRPVPFTGLWTEVIREAEVLGIGSARELKPDDLLDALMRAAAKRVESGVMTSPEEQTRRLSLHGRVAMDATHPRQAVVIPVHQGMGLAGHAPEHGLGREDFVSIASFRVGLLAAVFATAPGDIRRLDALCGQHRMAGDFSEAGWRLQFGDPAID